MIREHGITVMTYGGLTVGDPIMASGSGGGSSGPPKPPKAPLKKPGKKKK